MNSRSSPAGFTEATCKEPTGTLLLLYLVHGIICIVQQGAVQINQQRGYLMVATVDFVTTMVHTLANQPTGALLYDFNWCQYSGPVHVLVKPTSPEGYGQVTAVVYAAGGVVVEGWVLTTYGPSCSVADLVRLVRDVTNYAHAANGYYADFTYATGNGVPLDFSLTKVHMVIWRAS